MPTHEMAYVLHLMGARLPTTQFTRPSAGLPAGEATHSEDPKSVFVSWTKLGQERILLVKVGHLPLGPIVGSDQCFETAQVIILYIFFSYVSNYNSVSVN